MLFCTLIGVVHFLFTTLFGALSSHGMILIICHCISISEQNCILVEECDQILPISNCLKHHNNKVARISQNLAILSHNYCLFASSGSLEAFLTVKILSCYHCRFISRSIFSRSVHHICIITIPYQCICMRVSR